MTPLYPLGWQAAWKLVMKHEGIGMNANLTVHFHGVSVRKCDVSLNAMVLDSRAPQNNKKIGVIDPDLWPLTFGCVQAAPGHLSVGGAQVT